MQDIIKLTSNDSIINLFFQERDHSEVISRSIHLTQQKNIINYGRINFFNIIDTTGIELANNTGCGDSGDMINLGDSSIIAINITGGVTYYHNYSLVPEWNYNFNSNRGPLGASHAKITALKNRSAIFTKPIVYPVNPIKNFTKKAGRREPVLLTTMTTKWMGKTVRCK